MSQISPYPLRRRLSRIRSAARADGGWRPGHLPRDPRSTVPSGLSGRLPLLGRVALLLVLLASPVLAADSGNADGRRYLMGGVAADGNQVVVARAGDLWTVARAGGEARRLTSHPAAEDHPALSADGRWLAFSRRGAGDWDAWVMPATGGEARRLTWAPGRDLVRGFTPDGDVLVASERRGPFHPRLFRISPEGGLPRAVDVPRALDGALTEDGRWLAYVPPSLLGSFFLDAAHWRHYRGGATGPLWLADLGTGRVLPGAVEIPGAPRPAPAASVDAGAAGARADVADPGRGAWRAPAFNHASPRWSGDRLLFTADPDGTDNVYEAVIASSPGGPGRPATARPRTTFVGHGVDALAVDGRGGAVFVQGGHLWALPPRGEARRLPVTFPVDRPEDRAAGRSDLASRRVPAQPWIESVVPWTVPAPGGESGESAGAAEEWAPALVIGARGEVLLWDAAATGDPRFRNLTATPGVAERSPVPSPDGQRVAYFSDASFSDPAPSGAALSDAATSGSATGNASSGIDSSDTVSSDTVSPVAVASLSVPRSDGRRAPRAISRHPVTAASGGGYHLEVRDVADGSLLQALPVEEHPTFYRDLQWSPDGRRLVFSGARLGLWLADLESGRVGRLDRSTYPAQESWQADWSPDGRWLAWSKVLPHRLRAVVLHEVESGRTLRLTDGTAHAEHPVFDAGGRYLWFVSSSDARLAAASDVGWGLLSSDRARPLVTRTLHLVVLAADDPSPLLDPPGRPNPLAAPADDGGEVRVDAEGLERRVVPVPAGTRDYLDLVAGPPGSVFARVAEWPATPGDAGAVPTPVYRVDLERAHKPRKVVEDADEMHVPAGGRGLLWSAGGRWYAGGGDGGAPEGDEEAGGQAAATSPPGDELDLAALQVEVEPAAEWRQMYHEAWRQLRDVFYDPALHGLDLAALESHFAAYLKTVDRREDLNELFLRMLGHVSVSHLVVSGGDRPEHPEAAEDPSVATGALGVDLEPEAGRWRIRRILRPAHYSHLHPLLRGPLAAPGLGVAEGDYLLAVDGRELTATDNPWSALEGKAQRPVEIRFASTPQGEPRTAVVVPLPTDSLLRLHAWGEERRRRVDELSGGRLGYMWLRGYSGTPLGDAWRAVLGMTDKEGLVLDQRFNGGGTTADSLVEALTRHRWYAYAFRHGAPFPVPPVAVPGPKVLITNPFNFSAAETFALMFRLAGAGPIVGERTAGGGIGAALDQPRLVDGGRLRIPNRAAFGPAGWIENRGVSPDLFVPLTPEDERRGRNPQLEAAVRLALEALEQGEEGARADDGELEPPPYPVHP